MVWVYGAPGIGSWCIVYPRRWSGKVCGVEGCLGRWCMAYRERWSGMSVW